MHSVALHPLTVCCCAAFRKALAPPVSWLLEGAQRRRTACWPRLRRSTTARELGPCLRPGRYGLLFLVVKKTLFSSFSLSLSPPSVLLSPGSAGAHIGCVEFRRPPEEQRFSALLQRLQHADHHAVLLRGHHTHTQ